MSASDWARATETSSSYVFIPPATSVHHINIIHINTHVQIYRLVWSPSNRKGQHNKCWAEGSSVLRLALDRSYTAATYIELLFIS